MSGVDAPAPWRIAFDNARDPYTARNALGAEKIGGGGGGGGGAPDNAEYIVAATDPTLTAERVLTNTATITWDFTTPGQAKASTAAGGGNVSNSGTPTLGQYAKWTTATTIQGVSAATVLSDIGAQPAGSYQPLDADLTAIAALAGVDVIYYRSAANTWTAVTIGANLTFTGGVLAASGGGGGTPGGSNTQVQFNDSSAFGGDADLTWNKTTNLLTVNGNISVTGGVGNSLLTNSVIQGSGFRCTGTAAIYSTELTGGVVNLRPNGFASTTGQFQVTTLGVTATTPITLPADPTTALQAATKQYVDLRAPLASPTFTGDPKAPTPATADNDTSIATTAYVQAQGYLTTSAAAAAYQPLDADLTAIAALTGTNTIYYRSAASTWTAVTIGSNMTFTGGTLDSVAGGSSASGALVLIQSQTVGSAVAAVDFTTGIGSTYDEYVVRAYGVQTSAGSSIILRISLDGGATFKAGASDYAYVNAGASATASSWAGGGTAASEIRVTYLSINNIALASANFVTQFAFPASTTLRKVFMNTAAGVDGTGAFRSVTSGVYGSSTGAINAIRFAAGTGNITAGVFNLYGIKK
jgi:hypothetical protein